MCSRMGELPKMAPIMSSRPEAAYTPGWCSHKQWEATSGSSLLTDFRY